MTTYFELLFETLGLAAIAFSLNIGEDSAASVQKTFSPALYLQLADDMLI